MGAEEVIARMDAAVLHHIQAAGRERPKYRTWCGLRIIDGRSGSEDFETLDGAPAHSVEIDGNCVYCPKCLGAEREWQEKQALRQGGIPDDG